jgi:hypothetical protein
MNPGMNPNRRTFLMLVGTAAASRFARAQYVLPPQAPPKETFPPTPAQAAEINRKLASLDSALKALKANNTSVDLIAEVEIFHKAGTWIGRFGEYYGEDVVSQINALLDMGLERASDVQSGKAPWKTQTGPVIRAYQSHIDDSVQPYIAYVPESYRPGRPTRLDVVIHGTNRGMVEVQFMSHKQIVSGSMPVPPVDFLEIEVLGRTNNAYRWAGETDVFEAVAATRKHYTVDENRITLRGFSMGGSGTWHLGLQHPDHWAAIEPGAGFNDTRDTLFWMVPQDIGEMPNLPSYQLKTLHIYDSWGYALNAFQLPTAAYTGELDGLSNLINVRNELVKSDIHFHREGLNWFTNDIPMIMLVGRNTPHRWEPHSRERANEYIDAAAKKGRTNPDHIRFVTYTTRFNRCFWVAVEGLDQHYERAEVDATRSKDDSTMHLRTKNVSALTLKTPGIKKIEIDGHSIAASGAELKLVKRGGAWAEGEHTGMHKRPGLQGPIDDAFYASFLCVRPTGQTGNDMVGRYAQETLVNFTDDFAKFFRGDARIKDDKDVTAEDMAQHHLILFGDPESNSMMKRVLAQLPIQWDTRQLVVGGHTYNAANHTIAMIHPNPLVPAKYVVLNSGHSFHHNEMAATNASLFPRFGDFAVLSLHQPVDEQVESEVVTAGYFDEDWKLALRA